MLDGNWDVGSCDRQSFVYTYISLHFGKTDNHMIRTTRGVVSRLATSIMQDSQIFKVSATRYFQDD